MGLLDVVRGSLVSLILLLGVGLPRASRAQWTFENEGTFGPCKSRFAWDFAEFGDGHVLDGTCDAFDGCMLLLVDDEPFPTSSYGSAYDGRGLSTDTEVVSGVNVTRWAYVPEGGRSFARWLDVFENPSGEVLDVTVRYTCDLGSDGDEAGHGSDGDAIAEVSDTWIASDVEDDDDPALAFLVQGEGARVGLRRWVSTPGSGSVDFEYELSLAAATTEALLVFVVQSEDRETSYDTATFLESLPPEATAFLDPELDIVRNFVAGGVPSLSMGGPYVIPEGTEVELEATYYDADDDEVTISWDLDGDGEYEASGARVTFDATDLDGPVDPPMEVGVRASDGEHVTTRRGQVEVVNIPPTLASFPDAEAVIGSPYSAPLEPRVVDPFPGDELYFELVDGPTGLQLDVSGTIRWTPTKDDLGEHHVRVRFSDDDGGETTADIPIHVRTNDPPAPPRLVSPDEDEVVRVTRPTFIVGNSADPDGDAVTYVISVSWNRLLEKGEPCAGVLEVTSGRLAGHPSGNTSWQPREPLCRGEGYTWSAHASDGYASSEVVERHFEVHEDAVDENGGPARGEDPAGCACRLPSGEGAAPGVLGIAVAALLLVDRRRACENHESRKRRREHAGGRTK